MFQSQTGSIRGRRGRRADFIQPSFNPKLVQLEELSSVSASRGSTAFQSQTGSIRGPRIARGLALQGSFNPKLVQLEAVIKTRPKAKLDMFQSQTGSIRGYREKLTIAEDELVSIPNWFN